MLDVAVIEGRCGERCYPTLTMLGELGHAVSADAEGGRKRHTITAESMAAIAAERAAAGDALAQLSALVQTRDDRNASLVCGMENLRSRCACDWSGTGWMPWRSRPSR